MENIFYNTHENVSSCCRSVSKKLGIIGASGHGKVIADIAEKNGYKDIFFLDDDIDKNECAGFPVLGKTDKAIQYDDCDFIIAIGNAEIRKHILKKTPNIVTLVHPDAAISRRVKIGRGTVIMAGAVINSDAVIGEGCIINTGASVDHDCIINDYCHISVGAHVAGTCHIGEGTWVGAGAIVSNNIDICCNCLIGAGAVVVKDIDIPGTYIGVPAKIINMNNNCKIIEGGIVAFRNKATQKYISRVSSLFAG